MLPPSEFRKALNKIPYIPVESNFYRFIKIQFIKHPLSGLGSLRHGGRYNYKNVFEVLYLTSDPDTAVAESSRDRLLIPPSVLITVRVRLQRVINIENEDVINSLGIIRAELNKPWRKIQDIDEKKAYTQVLGELIYDSREFEAIRYPSAIRNGKYNLALFTERLRNSSEVKVYDPEHRINKFAAKKIMGYRGFLKGVDTTTEKEEDRY